MNLTNNNKGRYSVLTEHSAYFLDLDNRTVCRSPREPDANDLRKDGETVPLLEIITCEEGVMMELMIQLRDDEIPTYRRSTAVVSIVPMEIVAA